MRAVPRSPFYLCCHPLAPTTRDMRFLEPSLLSRRLSSAVLNLKSLARPLSTPILATYLPTTPTPLR